MTVEMKVRKFNKRMTLHLDIVVTREYKFRKWVAIRLMRLAAWVLDCNIEVHSQ